MSLTWAALQYVLKTKMLGNLERVRGDSRSETPYTLKVCCCLSRPTDHLTWTL